jgi:formylglycine-generating enzyme
MKKLILFLVFLAVSHSLYAAKPTVKFYLNDGNFKTYNISDIDNLSFIKSKISSGMTVYNKIDSLTRFYDVGFINKIQFVDGEKIEIILFDTTVFHNFADIDSITIKTGITIKTVLIPAGTFQMGNTGAYSGSSYEKPVHTVTISKSFYMGKYELTQKQYEEVMGTKPSYFKGENLPVEMVSWYEAVEYCNKLSDQDGLAQCYIINGVNVSCNWNANGWRLPTEAEWEYACKAGTTTDFYSGSLTNEYCTPIDASLDRIGWYCGNSDDKTHPVGQKQANSFGLYDMSGNVWEWCWDWFKDYTNTSVTDPRGENSGSYHVLRGGSWYYIAGNCRNSIRSYSYPDVQIYINGFRICRNY